MNIRMSDFKIVQSLQRAKDNPNMYRLEIDEKLKELGIPNLFNNINNLYNDISLFLKKVGFKLIIMDLSKFSFSSITFDIVNGKNINTIIIDKNIKTYAIFIETIIHEISHIISNKKGLLTTKPTEIQKQYIFHKDNFYKVLEYEIDLISSEILMPRKSFLSDLINSYYDFKLISNKYNVSIKTSMQWCIINDILKCHYIELDDTKAQQIPDIIDYYLDENSPNDFINNILNSKESQLHKTIADKKDYKGSSFILSHNYFCYSYYDNQFIYVYGWNENDYKIATQILHKK